MTQEQRNKKAEQLRLAAHIIETGCEWEILSKADDVWKDGHFSTPITVLSLGYEIRIKKPVIQVPEGYRELRDDEKKGQWIEGAKFYSYGVWDQLGVSSLGCFAGINSRIIVPVAKKLVPLEPCDVPPGACIKPSNEYVGWGMICEMDSSGIHLGESRHLSFKNLMDNNWSIKRPTDTEWMPCSKEAES